MIKNIVFDMGKVLLEWEPQLTCYRYAKNREDAMLLCKAIFERPEWGKMIDGGLAKDEEYVESILKDLPNEHLHSLARAIAKDYWLDALYPKQHMNKVIEWLLAKGYKLYILSNCGFSFHSFSYKIPCIDQFSGILVSAEEKMLKPDPRIFNRLCDKFSLNPTECFFVDDLPANVEGARSIGMSAYCFADGNVDKLIETLKAL